MTKVVNGLEDKIREAILSHDSYHEDWKFELLENGGVITLTGTVPSQEDAQLIESIAMEQDGVATVINEIRVDDSNDSLIDKLRIMPPGK